MEDLHVGRWRSTQQLLAATGRNWTMRTARSQVLAASAVAQDAIAAWLTEEPRNANAMMMRARVLTQEVLTEHRHNPTAALSEDFSLAREACRTAAHLVARDPVPWVCLLSLAQLDLDPRRSPFPEHWAHAHDPLLPAAPWGLLHEVERRDPGNREAYHRMLTVFHTRGYCAIDFAHVAAAKAHHGSPLLMLPLYAYAELYRQRLQNPRADIFRFWLDHPVAAHTERALRSWFAWTQPRQNAPLDLNHLAYALVAGGHAHHAGAVFEAIGPYATPAPWQHLSNFPAQWQDEFKKARDYATRHPPHT
ncbi:hypothetical protein ACIPJS_37655 [Streptomyces sp. NPDC086783]|uniref:hypothetical protein n=1 Tax=Streptomyces sp. NPDC086783 TaxID=3365758 RepID=UPI003829FED6